MIIDHIQNAERYFSLGDGFRQALIFLTQYEPEAQAVRGDVSLSGEDIFVKIRPYVTKPESECAYEVHRLYADIHYVAQGCERMGWTDAAQTPTGTYDPVKDTQFVDTQGQLIPLKAGCFAIFFPGEAHMPCVQGENSGTCVKVVAKVKL